MPNTFKGIAHWHQDESKRYVQEIASMEKPELKRMDMQRRYQAEMQKYNEHLASLKRYPASWLTESMHNTEVECLLQWQVKRLTGDWEDCDRITFGWAHNHLEQRTRIIALPIEQSKGEDDDVRTMQFPGSSGSDIHKTNEQEEIENFLKSGKPIEYDCSFRKELSEVLEWLVLFYGSLNELVQLKQNKEQEGETPDYLERKPKAWYLAKEAIRLWKESDYGAKPLPATSPSAAEEDELWKEFYNQWSNEKGAKDNIEYLKSKFNITRK